MINKVAIVTGSGRGIGRGIALGLAKEGWSIVVADLGPAEESTETAQLVQLMDADVHVIHTDVTKDTDRVHLVDDAIAQFGRIDLLVNNAGMAPRQRMDMLEMTEESYDEVMTANLKGPFFLSQRVAKVMIAQEPASVAPAIINTGSINAFTSSTSRAEYCLSKAGVSMMTQLFADRLAGHGINVYEIRPGIIETDMTRVVKEKYDTLIEGGLTPIMRWGQPDDIARAVVAIAEGYFPFTTGEVFHVDGGFHLKRL
ncbi:MAG: 3-ketoacyl-ACP reductase [Chloroflexota bacterium]